MSRNNRNLRPLNINKFVNANPKFKNDCSLQKLLVDSVNTSDSQQVAIFRSLHDSRNSKNETFHDFYENYWQKICQDKAIRDDISSVVKHSSFPTLTPAQYNAAKINNEPWVNAIKMWLLGLTKYEEFETIKQNHPEEIDALDDIIFNFNMPLGFVIHLEFHSKLAVNLTVKLNKYKNSYDKYLKIVKDLQVMTSHPIIRVTHTNPVKIQTQELVIGGIHCPLFCNYIKTSDGKYKLSSIEGDPLLLDALENNNSQKFFDFVKKLFKQFKPHPYEYHIFYLFELAKELNVPCNLDGFNLVEIFDDIKGEIFLENNEFYKLLEESKNGIQFNLDIDNTEDMEKVNFELRIPIKNEDDEEFKSISKLSFHKEELLVLFNIFVEQYAKLQHIDFGFLGLKTDKYNDYLSLAQKSPHEALKKAIKHANDDPNSRTARALKVAAYEIHAKKLLVNPTNKNIVELQKLAVILDIPQDPYLELLLVRNSKNDIIKTTDAPNHHVPLQLLEDDEREEEIDLPQQPQSMLDIVKKSYETSLMKYESTFATDGFRDTGQSALFDLDIPRQSQIAFEDAEKQALINIRKRFPKLRTWNDERLLPYLLNKSQGSFSFIAPQYLLNMHNVNTSIIVVEGKEKFFKEEFFMDGDELKLKVEYRMSRNGKVFTYAHAILKFDENSKDNNLYEIPGNYIVEFYSCDKLLSDLCEKKITQREYEQRVYQDNIDLSDVNLSHADLKNAKFIEANLAWAILESADLSNADLSNADLTNANLTSATLTNTTLDGIIISNTTKLSNAKLKKVNFNENVDFKYVMIDEKSNQPICVLKITPIEFWKYYKNAAVKLGGRTNAGGLGDSRTIGQKVVLTIQYAQENPDGKTALSLKNAYYEAYKDQVRKALSHSVNQRELLCSLINLADHLKLKRNLRGLPLKGIDLTGLDIGEADLQNTGISDDEIDNTLLSYGKLQVTPKKLWREFLERYQYISGEQQSNAVQENIVNITNRKNISDHDKLRQVLNHARKNPNKRTMQALNRTAYFLYKQQLKNEFGLLEISRDKLDIFKKDMVGADFEDLSLVNLTRYRTYHEFHSLLKKALTEGIYDAYDKRKLIDKLIQLADEEKIKADLSGFDLRGADLNGFDFSGVSLEGADIRGATFKNAIFNEHTNFKNVITSDKYLPSKFKLSLTDDLTTNFTVTPSNFYTYFRKHYSDAVKSNSFLHTRSEDKITFSKLKSPHEKFTAIMQRVEKKKDKSPDSRTVRAYYKTVYQLQKMEYEKGGRRLTLEDVEHLRKILKHCNENLSSKYQLVDASLDFIFMLDPLKFHNEKLSPPNDESQETTPTNFTREFFSGAGPKTYQCNGLTILDYFKALSIEDFIFILNQVKFPQIDDKNDLCKKFVLWKKNSNNLPEFIFNTNDDPSSTAFKKALMQQWLYHAKDQKRPLTTVEAEIPVDFIHSSEKFMQTFNQNRLGYAKAFLISPPRNIYLADPSLSAGTGVAADPHTQFSTYGTGNMQAPVEAKEQKGIMHFKISFNNNNIVYEVKSAYSVLGENDSEVSAILHFDENGKLIKIPEVTSNTKTLQTYFNFPELSKKIDGENIEDLHAYAQKVVKSFPLLSPEKRKEFSKQFLEFVKTMNVKSGSFEALNSGSDTVTTLKDIKEIYRTITTYPKFFNKLEKMKGISPEEKLVRVLAYAAENPKLGTGKAVQKYIIDNSPIRRSSSSQVSNQSFTANMRGRSLSKREEDRPNNGSIDRSPNS